MLSPVILPLTLRLLCGSVVELDTLGHDPGSLRHDRESLQLLAMVLCRLLGQEASVPT